ncbi:MAG: DUF2334 domain-containing protein [Anaerolineae bacterium]|nr:DUF2334 domain-containing protein [Anaerolineae bacterium]
MQIIFRDDDTSFFTTPAMLEDIYEPLWERNLPVCLSVIPAHLGNIVLWDGTFDPNVAPQYRGVDKNFSVADNPEICAFLNNMAKQGLVEICLHGFNHEYPEFGSEDEARLRQKLTEGRALLEQTFPDAPINTFIIPYDKVSKPALHLLLDSGYHTCVDPHNIPTDSSYAGAPFYRTRQLDNGAKFFTSGGAGYHNNIDEWREALTDPAATLVIINHYYMFYDNFGTVRAPMLAGWRSAANELLDEYAAHVTTFTKAQADAVEVA